MSREQYQTVREVAGLLQVNEATVRRWIRDGELRAIDIGKGWRIGPDDLDAFLEGHATRPSARLDGGADRPPAIPKARETKEQKT